MREASSISGARLFRVLRERNSPAGPDSWLESTPRSPRTVALVCALAIGWGMTLCAITRSPLTKRTDFFYYYCVSKLVDQGRGSFIYAADVLGALERRLASPIKVPGGLIPNVYPPVFALVVAPLTRLPYTAGYVLWLLLNCIILGLSLAWLERYARLGRVGRIVFRAASFLALPVFVALLLGQVSCILLGLLCVTLHAARRGMDALAGVALGFTLIKPQYALPFVLVFLVRRRYRTLAGFAATALALLIVPGLVLGWSVDVDYLHTLMHAFSWGSSTGGFAPSANRSFGGLTQLLVPGRVGTGIALGLGLLALTAVVVAGLTCTELDIPFGLAVVVALLAGQHTLIHDLTLLLVPLAVAARHQQRGARGIAVAGGLLFASSYVGFSTALTHSIQLPAIAMTAFAAWLCTMALTRFSAPVSPNPSSA